MIGKSRGRLRGVALRGRPSVRGVGRIAMIALAASLVLGSAAAARAQEEPSRQSETSTEVAGADPRASVADPDHPLRPGSMWGLFYGYGFHQVINGSARIDVTSGGVRWSYLGSRHGTGALSGHHAFAIELLPFMGFLAEAGANAYGGGVNLLYERHFVAAGRVLPILRIGAGGLYTNHEVPEDEVKFNFSLLTGLGFDVPLNDSTALGIEYRFHHVSNANRGPVNPGVNAHTVLFGVSFYR